MAAGDTRVQFGVTEGCPVGGGSKLEMANPDMVDRPQKGMQFDL